MTSGLPDMERPVRDQVWFDHPILRTGERLIAFGEALERK